MPRTSLTDVWYPRSSNKKIANELRNQLATLRVQLAESRLKADSLTRINRAHEQKHQCESLYAQGRTYDAAESLLEIVNTINEDIRGDKLIFDWLAGEF